MGWYNSSWLKRQKITLAGDSSGSQTNYQIKLTVTWDSDMQSDFDDLRFTKSNGTELIDAWLESKTDSVTADIWVEFPTTPANGETEDYYMYYGNSAAVSDWDADATFIFFDDFSGSTLDLTKWTQTTEGTTTSVVNGDYVRLHSNDGNVNKQWIKANIAASRNQKLRYRFRQSTAQYNGSVQLKNVAATDSVGHSIRGGYSSNSTWGVNINGVIHKSETVTTIAANTWATCEIILGESYQEFKQDASSWTDNGSMRDEQYYIEIFEGSAYNAAYDLDISYTIVSKWVTNPSTYGFGSEEIESAGGNYMHRTAGIPGMQYTGRRSW